MVAEQAGKGPVQYVEPAGQYTEGRQDQPCPIAHERPPAHRAAVAAHLGGGMQVAGDFAAGSIGLRFVAQGQAVGDDDIGAPAGKGGRQDRVVIARDPQPLASRLQRAKPRLFAPPQPAGTPLVL